MIDPSICRERILSEDFYDFILNDIRTPFLTGITQEDLCSQDAGFGYRCLYLSRLQSGPLSLDKFTYHSIPLCYTPTSLDTLNQAGILPLQNYPTLQLTGKGILIGFLDGGIDYQNPIFRNIDGSSRIVGIWDQTVQTGTPPAGFAYGSEYDQDTIDQALKLDQPFDLVPTVDETGHGTFTASLACGGGVPEESFLGAAPDAAIAVVKLKSAKQYLKDYYFIPDGVPCYQENDIILGLYYLDQLAKRLDLPLVYCITLGTSGGGHLGDRPLPLVLNGYGSLANRIPVIGTGNEADKRHHFYNEIPDQQTSQTVEIRVGEQVTGFTMELWTSIPNILSIALTSPSGETTTRIPIRVNSRTDFEFLYERTKVTIDYRLIVEKGTAELIFFQFDQPSPGIWKIEVEPVRIIDGRYHLWLPVSEFLSGEVYFLDSNPDYTILNPGNSASPVTVSYYDGANGAVALASGRGYSRNDRIEPSITAPGINVKGALPSGRFAVRSGASISCAVTAGTVALLLEWILKKMGTPGIDAFQIQSILILGAVRAPGKEFPNREWGYGQLNLFNTFNEIRML